MNLLAKSIWQNLTQPSASIQDTEQRRRANLLSVLLIPLVIFSLIGALYPAEQAGALFGVFITLSITYGLSRTRHYVLAAYLSVGVLSIPSFVLVIVATDHSLYSTSTRLLWVALAVAMGGLVLSLRDMAIICTLNLVVILLLPLLVPGLAFNAIASSVSFVALISILILLANFVREQQQSRIELQARELREIEESNLKRLEELVVERTSELRKTNEQLQEEIIERKHVQEQISASLHVKDILLKEIHHRVKNNLQIISSLLMFQAEASSNSQVDEALMESRNRIHSMATIHEVLYQSGDLAQIDFTNYTRMLTKHLLHTYNINKQNITLKMNIANIQLGIDTAIYCGFIINELVSNSLKHAFPANRVGEIEIELRQAEDNQLILTVRDDGVGIPSDMDIEMTESLGLKLVTIFTKQLEGEIELDQNRGTTCIIKFNSKTC